MEFLTFVKMATLVIIAAGLIVSVCQLRNVARQVRIAVTNLEQSSQVALLTSEKDLASLFLNEPEVMRWHFESHGFGTLTTGQAKILTFILLRLSIHEATFLSNTKNGVSPDAWQGWDRVIVADFAIKEYREAWRVARLFYASSFASHVDKLL